MVLVSDKCTRWRKGFVVRLPLGLIWPNPLFRVLDSSSCFRVQPPTGGTLESNREPTTRNRSGTEKHGGGRTKVLLRFLRTGWWTCHNHTVSTSYRLDFSKTCRFSPNVVNNEKINIHYNPFFQKIVPSFDCRGSLPDSGIRRTIIPFVTVVFNQRGTRTKSGVKRNTFGERVSQRGTPMFYRYH